MKYIEAKEKYPFGVRNFYEDAMFAKITRPTVNGVEEVPLHVDLGLTTIEKSITIRNNLKQKMSNWHMIKESVSYAWISERACKLAEEISKELSKTKFECHEMWGVHYKEKTNAKPHRHWLYQYAFGYYIKVPEYAPIVFPTANCEYNPKPGDLIVFPGHITHEVKPVDGERIMVAGNLRNTFWDVERNLQNSAIVDIKKQPQE